VLAVLAAAVILYITIPPGTLIQAVADFGFRWEEIGHCLGREAADLVTRSVVSPDNNFVTPLVKFDDGAARQNGEGDKHRKLNDYDLLSKRFALVISKSPSSIGSLA
jgi:hypothetical protein